VSAAREKILGEIAAERVRQDAKWGEQNHPDVVRAHGALPVARSVVRVCEEHGIPHPQLAKFECDCAAQIGQCTWAHILVEEIAEAVEAATLAQLGQGPLTALRKELVQVAAVAVSWIEAIDRRGER